MIHYYFPHRQKRLKVNKTCNYFKGQFYDIFCFMGDSEIVSYPDDTTSFSVCETKMFVISKLEFRKAKTRFLVLLLLLSLRLRIIFVGPGALQLPPQQKISSFYQNTSRIIYRHQTSSLKMLSFNKPEKLATKIFKTHNNLQKSSL